MLVTRSDTAQKKHHHGEVIELRIELRSKTQVQQNNVPLLYSSLLFPLPLSCFDSFFATFLSASSSPPFLLLGLALFAERALPALSSLLPPTPPSVSHPCYNSRLVLEANRLKPPHLSS